MAPGSAALDAPVSGTAGPWFLDYLREGFTLALFAEGEPAAGPLRELVALAADPIPCSSVLVGAGAAALPAGVCRAQPRSTLLGERYDARPGTTYLFRPDQHVCARSRVFDLGRTRAAIARATAQTVH